MEGKAGAKAERANPWSAALKLLTRRDYSQSELRQRLSDKGFEHDLIEAALQRCLELGYLDDERFANTRARSLVNSGRAVGIRLLNELKKAGIERPLAERALATAESEADLPALVDDIRQRKFPGFEFNRATDKEKNRVVSYLQRRGFPVSMILDVLKNQEDS